MKQLLDQVEELWCHAMHTDVMWPVHGEYRCRTCLRAYPVQFEALVARPVHAHQSLRPADSRI